MLKVHISLSFNEQVHLTTYPVDIINNNMLIYPDKIPKIRFHLHMFFLPNQQYIATAAKIGIHQLIKNTLHWLPIAQRICYRIAVLGWRCLLGGAPGYLCELCRPVSGLPGRRALRSSVTGQLLVPRAKTATRQRRAFSIVGLSTWNGLPLEIRILPKNNESAFCRLFKTDLYCRGWAGGASLSRFLEEVPYKFLNE